MPLRPNMEMSEYLEILRRRKWYIVFSILVILFGATVYVVVAPEQFKSSTTILVIPQRVPEGYVRSTVSSRVDERLFTIQQQVMSRTRLIAVMEELGLFKEERRKKSVEEVVEMMRKRIDIKIASLTERRRRDSGDDAFTLTFIHENPHMAMLTASRLASFFVDENLKTREQQAVGTSEFLESQLQETKKRLEAQEEKVKRYKLKFSGELPQQLQANLMILSRLQEQMKANSDAMRSAQDRKVFVEAQINALEAHIMAIEAQARPPGEGPLREADPARAIQAELAEKKSQLANLSAKYTESYPEVRRLKGEIPYLEERLQSALKQPHAVNNPSVDNGSQSVATIRQSPFGMATREREEIIRLQAQNAEIDTQMRYLYENAKNIQRDIAQLEAKVAKSPQREQEMVSLTRDYENLKMSYDDLLKKRLEAQVSQNLEIRQKGEQFQILDPAGLPQIPFSPDRPKILGFALAAALALGFGGAIGWEMMSPALRGKRDFLHYFQVPVLASIPIIRDAEYEQREKRKKMALYCGLFSFTLAVTAFFIIFGNKVRNILAGTVG